MSGPKSVAYRPSAEELARRAELNALLAATSRFRVLSAELEAVRSVAAETSTAFGLTVAIPSPPARAADSAGEVENQNAEIERALAHARGRVHSAQRQAEGERLASYLSSLGEIDDPSTGSAAPSSSSSSSPARGGTIEPFRVRAEEYLATLAPGAQLSERAMDLAGGLASAPPDLASLALRDLQAEIGRINRAAKRKAILDGRLEDLDVRAGMLDRPELLRDVLLARNDPAAASEERVDALERRVAAEEKALAAARARDAARIAMERALMAEGYEVVHGFDTAVPRDGVLVRRPGLDFHAWRVGVGDDSMHLDVVRTALDADPRMSAARDIEAETRICADLPAVLGRISAAGVDVGRIRRLAPGDSPVAVLPDAKPMQQSTGSARTPEERSL